MNKKIFSKVVMGSLLSATMLASMSAIAGNDDLTPQDAMVTTIIDKSVIHGELAHDAAGNLIYDSNGYARFKYKGQIYSVETDRDTGELKEMDDPIGEITGEAAFPKDFVAMSAGVNALMDSMIAGTWDGTMPQMPPVVPWTCNHCDMWAGGTHYVSIVDVLNEYDEDGMKNEFYNVFGIKDKFDNGLMGGSANALTSMGMDGRAFTGLTPASFDPATKTMSVRMAGCSALVAVEGPHAGKMGTLCMNSTATFDVSGAKPIFEMTISGPKLVGYEPDSAITADGSSNCVTVLHTPTM